MNNGLYDKLIKYGKNGNYGFHMPGHKRNVKFLEDMDVFDIDITEISDFDNLHHAEGIIKEAMDNASDFWGTDKTWFLVNGSSCGILAAINAVTDIGDGIIIGRNCHKAVYNAATIRDLNVTYLYPEYISEYGINGGYNPEKLEELFEQNKDIKAVVITSPTYDGIVSDVEKMAEITHRYGAVLIVDEAHGAHLGISDKLPVPAYRLGADLVIESIHKTLPSLTQTAMLHMCGDRVSSDKVEECLGVYQSSSPSYVFMAAIDKCIRQLQKDGKENIERLLTIDETFRKNVNNLKYFFVPGKEMIGTKNVYDVDITKFVIYVDPKVCDGKRLADILRDEYHFEMEMESIKYVLAITTICDDENEIMRLAESLEEIESRFCDIESSEDKNCFDGKGNHSKVTDFEPAMKQLGITDFELLKNEVTYSICEAKKRCADKVKIESSEGMVSAEFLYLYPPGIPLLVPGEVISKELLEQISDFKRRNMNINGLKDKENRYIEVVRG